MSKPIICLDFDGVIHSYTSGWKGARNIPDPPVKGSIEFILEALEAGFDVAIHSSRARYFGGIWAMRSWLRKHSGGIWHETGFGPGIEDARFVRWKPPALITLDDRAWTFQGVWPDLASIKAFKPWNKR